MLQRFVDQAAVEAEIAHVTVPWTVPAAAPVNGIVHVPAHNTPMKLGHREVLLIAIAKGPQMDQGRRARPKLRRDRAPGRKAERHVRHLAPLVFVSPRVITAIINGTAPAGLTATPDSWGRRVVDTLDNDVGCPRQSTHLSGPRDTPNSSIADLLKSPAKRLHRQSTVTPQWSGIAAPLVRSRNDRAARK